MANYSKKSTVQMIEYRRIQKYADMFTLLSRDLQKGYVRKR